MSEILKQKVTDPVYFHEEKYWTHHCQDAKSLYCGMMPTFLDCQRLHENIDFLCITFMPIETDSLPPMTQSQNTLKVFSELHLKHLLHCNRQPETSLVCPHKPKTHIMLTLDHEDCLSVRCHLPHGFFWNCLMHLNLAYEAPQNLIFPCYLEALVSL